MEVVPEGGRVIDAALQFAEVPRVHASVLLVRFSSGCGLATILRTLHDTVAITDRLSSSRTHAAALQFCSTRHRSHGRRQLSTINCPKSILDGSRLPLNTPLLGG